VQEGIEEGPNETEGLPLGFVVRNEDGCAVTDGLTDCWLLGKMLGMFEGVEKLGATDSATADGCLLLEPEKIVATI
jgi:hypothetical protein